MLNGILWRFRTGAPWRDSLSATVPGRRSTVDLSGDGRRRVRDRILDAVSEAFDGDIVMIDSSCVRVHQHGAVVKRGLLTMAAREAPGVG